MGSGKNRTRKVREPYAKKACVNCRKAKAKCDNGRPCRRCVKMNLAHECVDPVPVQRKRKRRKKKNMNDKYMRATKLSQYPRSEDNQQNNHHYYPSLQEFLPFVPTSPKHNKQPYPAVPPPNYGAGNPNADQFIRGNPHFNVRSNPKESFDKTRQYYHHLYNNPPPPTKSGFGDDDDEFPELPEYLSPKRLEPPPPPNDNNNSNEADQKQIDHYYNNFPINTFGMDDKYKSYSPGALPQPNENNNNNDSSKQIAVIENPFFHSPRRRNNHNRHQHHHYHHPQQYYQGGDGQSSSTNQNGDDNESEIDFFNTGEYDVDLEDIPIEDLPMITNPVINNDQNSNGYNLEFHNHSNQPTKNRFLEPPQRPPDRQHQQQHHHHQRIHHHRPPLLPPPTTGGLGGRRSRDGQGGGQRNEMREGPPELLGMDSGRINSSNSNFDVGDDYGGFGGPDDDFLGLGDLDIGATGNSPSTYGLGDDGDISPLRLDFGDIDGGGLSGDNNVEEIPSPTLLSSMGRFGDIDEGEDDDGFGF